MSNREREDFFPTFPKTLFQNSIGTLNIVQVNLTDKLISFGEKIRLSQFFVLKGIHVTPIYSAHFFYFYDNYYNSYGNCLLQLISAKVDILHGNS